VNLLAFEPKGVVHLTRFLAMLLRTSQGGETGSDLGSIAGAGKAGEPTWLTTAHQAFELYAGLRI
jgi:hypothetical protein